VATKRMLISLLAERDRIVEQLVTAQMVGSENREAYWRRCFWRVTDEINEVCRELGLPRIRVCQLPLFVFIDDEVTNVTNE
jgi:hypothetical protein